jgi:hypothetical protein
MLSRSGLTDRAPDSADMLADPVGSPPRGPASRLGGEPANVRTHGPQRFALALMLLRTASVTDELALPLAAGRGAGAPRIDRSMEAR